MQTAIARHAKSGRWVTVAAFTEATRYKTTNYLADMTARCRSHTDFEMLDMNWEAAKAICAERNRLLEESLLPAQGSMGQQRKRKS